MLGSSFDFKTIETIDLFGIDRCMFESNFPVDKGSCSYGVLWNAFKKISANFSNGEKNKLFYNLWMIVHW